MTSRKYSRKGIKTNPKTFRQYKSAVNKVLWRKYRQTRETVGLGIDDLKFAFANDVAVLTVVEEAVGK